MDLALYQKPGSAFLYIPTFSNYLEHVLEAFNRGECMRVVKLNSSESRFSQHRELFRHPLLARSYLHKFIGKVFYMVSYADRHKFLYERHLAPKEKDKAPRRSTSRRKRRRARRNTTSSRNRRSRRSGSPWTSSLECSTRGAQSRVWVWERCGVTVFMYALHACSTLVFS